MFPFELEGLIDLSVDPSCYIKEGIIGGPQHREALQPKDENQQRSNG